MTLRTPPLYLQAGSHTAENDRLGIQGLNGLQGVGNAPAALPQSGACTGDLAVVQSATPAMTASVGTGWAWVLGTTSATQGMYQTYNDAAVTVTVTSADPTLARIDLVCLTIRDSAYAGASNDCLLQVVAGTAAASPTAPALPASSLSLATIAVAAASTTVITANITDTRVRGGQTDLMIRAASVGDDSLTLQAIASQTGYLLAVRDVNGTLVNGITVAGALVSGSGGGGSVADILLYGGM